MAEVIGTAEIQTPTGPFRSGPGYDLADPRIREVDRCPACGGTWFDAGEVEPGLREIAPDPGRARFYRLTHRKPEPVDGEPVAVCPRCLVPMQAIRSGAAPDVIYDRCPQCRGVWFDARELVRFAGPVQSLLALLNREFE